jgi:hypothetical protein
MGAQQNAQQLCSSELLLRFGCASVSVISSFLTIINRLLTSTYKRESRTENPCVGGSTPPLPIKLIKEKARTY